MEVQSHLKLFSNYNNNSNKLITQKQKDDLSFLIVGN